MEILRYGDIDIEKQTIYIDVDDVVLQSQERIQEIIKQKYNHTGEVKDKETVDWCFKSIYRKLTYDELEGYFDSDLFWQSIKLKPDILKLVSSLKEYYNFIFVTKGTEDNIKKKFNYLYKFKEFESFGFYAIQPNESKSIVRMFNGIQIDDNYNYLKDTDAKVKILLKNDKDTNYNSYYLIKDNLENLYILNNLEEILNLLIFNVECKL